LKKAIYEINAVSQITDLAISTLNLNELLTRFLEQLVSITGADAAVILIKEDGNLVVRASIGLEEEVEENFSVPIGEGFAGMIAETMQPSYVANVQNNKLILNPFIKNRGISSMIGVPLIVAGDVIGVLHADWFEYHPEDSREIRTFGLVADRIALAVANARLYAKTKEELSRTRLLQGVTAAATTGPNVREIADRIIDELSDHAHVAIAIIFTLKEDDDFFRAIASFGLPAGLENAELNLPIENDDLLITRSLKENIILTHEEDIDNPDELEFLEKVGFSRCRYVSIPFGFREKVFGIIALAFSKIQVFTGDEIELFGSIGRIAGQAFENARLFTVEQSIADTLQEALLTIPEKVPNMEFGHFYRSAAEAAQVGGDFYDIFEMEYDKVGIVIGDVSGKGVEAATITSTVKNGIRSFSYEYDSPDRIMARTNELVTKNTSSSIFVTVFLGILDTRSGELTYCSAGHPPAMLKHERSVELLQEYSPIIGAFSGIGYASGKTILKDGDTLVLHTDGIIEARRGDDFYGEDRLVEFINKVEVKSIAELPEEMFDDVTKFSDGVTTDDIAILVVALSRERSSAGIKPDRYMR
ncbi:MAG: SpoIIE family protein phosphatase, partial [Rubrobacteridae bacterium]|nr:SpoIIE family protein phosphatase [Rubrobacteridae bacterium]